jgi:hypothetical protein
MSSTPLNFLWVQDLRNARRWDGSRVRVFMPVACALRRFARKMHSFLNPRPGSRDLSASPQREPVPRGGTEQRRRSMAYASWLYNVNNIIGYTGDVNSRPTVYFQLGRGYGHITQNHSIPSNIGREKYEIHHDYRIDNYDIDGELHAVESEATKVFHVSRNEFIPRRDFNPGELLTLSIAIYRFPDLKLMYVASRRQQRAKATMQAELLNQFDQVRNNRLQLFYNGADQNPGATRVIDKVI